MASSTPTPKHNYIFFIVIITTLQNDFEYHWPEQHKIAFLQNIAHLTVKNIPRYFSDRNQTLSRLSKEHKQFCLLIFFNIFGKLPHPLSGSRTLRSTLRCTRFVLLRSIDNKCSSTSIAIIAIQVFKIIYQWSWKMRRFVASSLSANFVIVKLVFLLVESSRYSYFSIFFHIQSKVFTLRYSIDANLKFADFLSCAEWLNFCMWHLLKFRFTEFNLRESKIHRRQILLILPDHSQSSARRW